MSSSPNLSSSASPAPAETPPADAAPAAMAAASAAVSPVPERHEAVVAGLGDVLCPLTVEIGSGTLTVRAVVELRRASILKMTQVAGKDLSLISNGVILATGEVVIVEDSTAIRVTEIANIPGADPQTPE